jgi:iron complex transport system substrate-binding protein
MNASRLRNHQNIPNGHLSSEVKRTELRLLVGCSTERIQEQSLPRFLRQGLESKNGMTQSDYPRRIVCLTEETVETLYLLGEQDRIVGVSGYARRPPEVRRKPRVSAFRDADIDAILHLKPDLILTFSDVQAEIARSLILRGATVLNFNQRTIAEIYEMIAVLARIVGKPDEGEALVARFRAGLEQVAASANKFAHHPRVYFEEWHDPLISGIGWVEDLIEIAGGELAFPELRKCGKAQDRVVNTAAVVARDPEVIFASWCGMQVKPDVIRSRPGWSNIAAVRNNHIYEVPSMLILQPGPAALTDGVAFIHDILARIAVPKPSTGSPVHPPQS